MLVVGTGDLGSSFARLCQTLGASTSGVRRDPAKPAAGIEHMYGFEALDTLLPAADVVALTLPQTPGTVRLFDKARLLRMKGDAILLNGGRGELRGRPGPWRRVLADGRLWGAGLDGTDPEPLPPGHPAGGSPGAHHTPHRWRKPPGGHRAPHRPASRWTTCAAIWRGGAAQPRPLKRPHRSCRRSSSGDRERGSRGMSNTVLQPACPAPAQAKGGSGKGGQDTGGELRVGVQRQFEFHQGPVLFLPARAAAAGRQSRRGAGRRGPGAAPPQRESAPWCRSRQVVGHGDDRLLDAGPVGPSSATTKHSRMCFCRVVSAGLAPLRTASRAAGTGDGTAAASGDAGDAADGVGVALADPRPQKV